MKHLILNEKLMFAVECGDGEEVERLLEVVNPLPVALS